MSMDAELYARVRKLEKQVEALLSRHPEVRTVLERDMLVAMNLDAALDDVCKRLEREHKERS